MKSIWSASAGGATQTYVGVGGLQGLKWLIAGAYMEQAKFYLNLLGGTGAGNVAVVGGKMAVEHTTDPAAVRVTNFPGNVSVVSSYILDIDPLRYGFPSTLRPTGAIIKQTGSAPTDIESFGNFYLTSPGYEVESATFTRSSDKVHVCDPAYAYSSGSQTFTLGQCYDFFESPGGSGAYYLGTPHGIGEGAADMPDIGTFTNPNSIDVQRLYAGLDLFRNTPIPGYYDEPGAQETYQVNLDTVKVFEPIYGIRINGGIPMDPSGLTGTAISAVQVNLSWSDNSSNEDGFKVRRATAAGGPFSDLSPNPAPGATAFSDTTTFEARQYWYTVAAYRTTTGESGQAASSQVRTPPRTPTSLTAVPNGSNQIVVGWVDNSLAETGFPVERATSSGGPYAVVVTAPPRVSVGSTTYVDTTVLDGTPYWYRVSAAKTGYPSSPTVGPTSATTPIKAPTTLVGTALTGRVNRLTFTDRSASEIGFDVQRAVKNGSTCGTYSIIGAAPSSAGTGSTVTYDDVGTGFNPPLATVTYCYQVRSTNAASQSSWVGPVSIKTKN